jgi:hypothetical protein
MNLKQEANAEYARMLPAYLFIVWLPACHHHCLSLLTNSNFPVLATRNNKERKADENFRAMMRDDAMHL